MVNKLYHYRDMQLSMTEATQGGIIIKHARFSQFRIGTGHPDLRCGTSYDQ